MGILSWKFWLSGVLKARKRSAMMLSLLRGQYSQRFGNGPEPRSLSRWDWAMLLVLLLLLLLLLCCDDDGSRRLLLFGKVASQIGTDGRRRGCSEYAPAYRGFVVALEIALLWFLLVGLVVVGPAGTKAGKIVDCISIIRLQVISIYSLCSSRLFFVQPMNIDRSHTDALTSIVTG